MASTQAPIAQRRETADAYGTAHALLKAFYPSLVNQRLYFAITGDDGVVMFDGLASPLMHFSVAVVKMPDMGDPNSRRSEVVSGHIDFDSAGQLTGWLASNSDFTNADRRLRLEARMGRELSDAQVATILGEAGVNYGPESEHEVIELVRPLLGRLEPFIGKARILGSAFRRSPHLIWIVEVQAQSDNTSFHYNLVFEPFQGKLTGIYGSQR